MTQDQSVSSSPDEQVDISATIDALCEQFGFDKRFVTWISFEPTTITFEVIEGGDVRRRVPHVFRVKT